MTKRLQGLLAAFVMAIGLVGFSASAAQAQAVGVQCTQVWRYVVIADGNMTDAPSNGAFVGWSRINDVFNVRIKGNPRYYGYNNGNGRWGWILTNTLRYDNYTWCA